MNEYIRSLGEIHRIQQTARNEFEGDKDNPTKQMMDGIRSGARFKLELRSSIDALKRMTLRKPFDELITNTISLYNNKMELYEEMSEISKYSLDTAPEPDVDYSSSTLLKLQFCPSP